MTIALRYAAYSDVGCLREGNEDSGYAGPNLLVVADGMGGHAGGEIASALAVHSLMPLDEDMPGSEMVRALENAVAAANDALARRVIQEPHLENMGTTLTAMLWSGARTVLVHVGDSRAYLLRNNELQQITSDHTLVQTLVDEGKITEDEVATHPQRSLLLRAIQGQGRVDPDLSVREAQIGDRYLLCSDGLSGVVSKETIHETLATERSPETAATRLIELAIRGGGPDNITAVVADVIDTAVDPLGPTATPTLVGAASQRREPAVTSDTPAGRAQELTRGAGDTAEMDRIPSYDPEDDEPDPPRTQRWWPMVLTFLVLVAIVAGAGFYFGRQFLASQYFVGASEDGEVAIYQGINTDVAGYSLATEVQRTDIPLDGLPDTERESVERSITVDSLDEAEERVATLRETFEACEREPSSCGLDDTDNGVAPTSAPTGDEEAQTPGTSAREPASQPNETDQGGQDTGGEQ
ncbi:Stp1/IreP family PP2C-type Ser/Thr phosphatase [Thermobifida halotolerans]|uniref:Serine/threonine protein phosphatase PstP n=1 Tax=Thermobifida halotolerans TaxID=483545 RepID=A0A399FWR1_9ACTN|nr:Stp1/IreP family PP2C-type Ser/Thr phosphatase [Thermobifida halotolerans]UOE18928.1 Stp1/IreP family PP2C-type Ser/Thr phosphatase [Thermobifida halotolerans]